MKTAIYYFTGTGNSLELAQKLANQLEADLIPIASVTGKEIDSSYQKVGIVYPTYMYRPPIIVVDFMKKLKPVDYLFAVANNGGDPGDVLARTRKLLHVQGLHLNAGFSVRLPDNYIPFGGPPQESKQSKIFEQADIVIAKIVETVKENKDRSWEKPAWFRTKIYPAFWYSIGYWAIPSYDKNFWLNDKCVGCASCTKVCPVGNITLEDKKPVWHNACQQCMACLQWCKPEAIEIGKKSKGVPRYRNPRIKRREIIAQAQKK